MASAGVAVTPCFVRDLRRAAVLITYNADMPSEAVNKATRREWRDLGFYHDRDDQRQEWRLIGSRAGLLRFKDALLRYAADPRNAEIAEHEHFGPYMYLEVMTWPEPGFDDHAIRGPLPDLARLARLIETKVAEAPPGSQIQIREEFAPNSPYSLILDVRSDGFDPAKADSALPPDEVR
jgi:hypothetical protein